MGKTNKNYDEEQEGLNVFDVITHLGAGLFGFTIGNLTGSRRERRKYERRLRDIESDLVWDTDPRTW